MSSTIRQTFTIPKELCEELRSIVPAQERSKFVTEILKKALLEYRKKELMERINNFKSIEPIGKSSVELLRELRS